MIILKFRDGQVVKINLFIFFGTILLHNYFHSWLLSIGLACMFLAVE